MLTYLALKLNRICFMLIIIRNQTQEGLWWSVELLMRTLVPFIWEKKYVHLIVSCSWKKCKCTHFCHRVLNKNYPTVLDWFLAYETRNKDMLSDLLFKRGNRIESNPIRYHHCGQLHHLSSPPCLVKEVLQEIPDSLKSRKKKHQEKH